MYEDGLWQWKKSVTTHKQTLKVNGDTANTGNTWILTEGVSSYTGTVNSGADGVKILTITGATEGNTAYEMLTFLDGIVEWLNKYGAQ